MAVPDYQSLMLPLLRYAAERGEELSTSEAVSALSERLRLSEDDLREMLPSGTQGTFINRVGWAATYMKKASLLEPTRRGFYQITSRGRDLVARNPNALSVKLLEEYPEFRAFKKLRHTAPEGGNGSAEAPSPAVTATPTEAIEEAYQNLRDELADELLDKLKRSSPTFFERTVVDVIVKLGYGGTFADAGRAIGRSGDGGIDGIIKEDKLGLDVIYIQAKRWDTTPVGRPDVMQFAGALQGQRASKGIFITTSRFTVEAREYVASIGSKIVLIDGEQLAQLMIDHDVGVSTAATYAVKRIDSDYFSEDL